MSVRLGYSPGGSEANTQFEGPGRCHELATLLLTKTIISFQRIYIGNTNTFSLDRWKLWLRSKRLLSKAERGHSFWSNLHCFQGITADRDKEKKVQDKDYLFQDNENFVFCESMLQEFRNT